MQTTVFMGKKRNEETKRSLCSASRRRFCRCSLDYERWQDGKKQNSVRSVRATQPESVIPKSTKFWKCLNMIEVQKNSYQWFLDEGLKEVFEDISPIHSTSAAIWYWNLLIFLWIPNPNTLLKNAEKETRPMPLPCVWRQDSTIENWMNWKNRKSLWVIFLWWQKQVPSSSMVRNVLLSASWFVLPVSITHLNLIRSARSCFPPQSSPTEVLGWNMKQIPTTYFM